MQLRSGRRLSPPRAPPAPRGQRRHRPAPRLPEVDGAGGDVEEDRISSLPDDLLLAILARPRLGCALEAARTSVLARRWRGLWTQLPVLVFDYVPFHKVEASLAQVTRRALDDLHLVVLLDGELAGRVSSLLRDIAERLAPKMLYIYFEGELEGYEQIELPCFRTTTTLSFCDHARLFALPPAGSKFEALTTLELDQCSEYLAGLVPMCPSLRYLNVTTSFGDVIIHSSSLEELHVDTNSNMDYLWDIDIRAPLLKKATFDFQAAWDLSVSFSAPRVKRINWDLKFGDEFFEDRMVRISFLDYSLESGVHKLSMLMFYLDDLSEAEELSFPEEIPQLPLLPHHLSFLKLMFHMKGHAFAPLVLHVLDIIPVTALNVEVELTHARQIGVQCPVDCPCEEDDSNWRDEDITLTDLEAVTLVGFNGHDEEEDFLKVLFRCVMDLQTMTVKVSSQGYKKISIICEQYPHVKCHVYLA